VGVSILLMFEPYDKKYYEATLNLLDSSTTMRTIFDTTMLASVLNALISTAYAAKITTLDPSWDGYKRISIEGEIALEDLARFKTLTAQFPADSKVIVMLNSPGGKVDAGWGIGQIVHDRGYETGAWGDQCNSVCADLWLAGSVRYIDKGTKIGFHRGYITVKDCRTFQIEPLKDHPSGKIAVEIDPVPEAYAS
jgi:hypothetical protein